MVTYLLPGLPGPRDVWAHSFASPDLSALEELEVKKVSRHFSCCVQWMLPSLTLLTPLFSPLPGFSRGCGQKWGPSLQCPGPHPPSFRGERSEGARSRHRPQPGPVVGTQLASEHLRILSYRHMVLFFFYLCLFIFFK